MKKLCIATAVAMLAAAPGLAGGNNNQNGPTFGGGGSEATATGIGVANASAGASAGASASVRNSNSNVNYNSANQGQTQTQGQLQGQGQSQDASNYNVVNNEAAASSAVAGAVAPAGNCGVGLGLGGSELSGSVSLGVTWQNIPCVVRMEAMQLNSMGMRDAAILHLANYHKRMGKTLERAGVVAKAAEPTTSARSSAPVVQAAYTRCDWADGKIRVGVRRGASDDQRSAAVSQCRAKLQ